MKIISKFKDYYDFVAGFDTDPIITYDRNIKKVLKQGDYVDEKIKNLIIDQKIFNSIQRDNLYWKLNSDLREQGQWLHLSFCNKSYNIFLTKKGDFIYTAEEFIDKVDNSKMTQLVYYDVYNMNTIKIFEPKETKNNIILNSPIFFESSEITLYYGRYINIRLSDIDFNKIIKPIETYQEIYNWISENKPTVKIPDSPTDISRYEAKGFDKKTSFRNIK